MLKLVQRRISANFTILGCMILFVMSALMLAAPKAATAGTSFSIGIGFGGGSVVYHSWSGGGYRPYHPGWYDGYHHWHAAYYYGPVVYAPPVNAYYWTNGAPHYYHHFSGGYGQPAYVHGGGWNHGGGYYGHGGGDYGHGGGDYGHGGGDYGHGQGNSHHGGGNWGH